MDAPDRASNMDCDAAAPIDDLFDSVEERRAYEDFCANQERIEHFELDKPALVCRWRMHRRCVPLLNRHIRALSQRCVNGAPLTANMLSWAKQHVEWSVTEGRYPDANGVLMLVIDVHGNAAMSVGAYEPLDDTSCEALRRRAAMARQEQRETGVAPEVLCYAYGGALLVLDGGATHACGTMTLVEQLAHVRGYEVRHLDEDEAPTEALPLLVSDEHGVVVANDAAATREEDDALASFLTQGIAKLFS